MFSNNIKLMLLIISIFALTIVIINICKQQNQRKNLLEYKKNEKYIRNKHYKVVVIIPYWKSSQKNIREVYNYYMKIKHVVGVYIIEQDGGNISDLPKENIIKGANDLRQRFKIISNEITKNIPKFDAVMIIDDDIIIPPDILNKIIVNTIDNPTELSGLWGRNYDNDMYHIKDRKGYVDAVLTKGFIAERNAYEKIASLVTKSGESFGIPALNCEDLYFSFLWKLFIGKPFAANVKIADIIDTRDTNDSSISSKPDHADKRTEIVKKFATQTLSSIYKNMISKPYKIAVVMWYDDGIADYANLTAEINETFCKEHNFTFIKSSERRMPDRKPHWERLPLMLEVLETDKYDYVMWIDADAAFIHENNKSDELLKLINFYNDKDILLSGDSDSRYAHRPFINSGVIIMKNTPNSRKILKYWMTDVCKSHGKKFNSGWNDQSCIRHSHFINYNNIQDYSHIIPFGTIQTFGDLFPKHNQPLIRHFTNGKFLKKNIRYNAIKDMHSRMQL